MSFRRATLIGLGSSLGQKTLTNKDMEEMVQTSDQWITDRTGIKERRILVDTEATSDLATRAAQMALEDSGLRPGDLDLIIVTTVTPDNQFPATACIVQANLGADRAAAFDISAGCTGFLYGLATAASFIEKGLYENVLVIGADTLSRITDYTDRSTCVLFGDGAGAAVVSVARGDDGILGICLGCDGEGAEYLSMPAGGSRLPASAKTVSEGQHFLKMEGQKVFEFAVKILGKASREALADAGIEMTDVDVVIPHQANIRIIEAARKRFKVPREKIVVNLDRYGNMSCGSIPVGLDEAVRSGQIKPGHIVLMVAFGAGLTWGAIVMRWGKNERG